MHRGDIWWAHLPQPSGHRPVVVISREKSVQLKNTVTIAQLTTTIRHIPVEVNLGPEHGVSKSCVINCDSLMSVPKTALHKYITHLSHEKQDELNHRLRYALDLN